MPSAIRTTIHQTAVEMTADPLFGRRVVRLMLTSIVALGLIWVLWATTLDTNSAIGIGLAAGWLLMPSILGLSLRWPKLRYALLVPSFLVSLSLLAIRVSALPDNGIARTGWLLITAGILFGGVLGLWFWFRWIPVPTSLNNPFSPGRWLLVWLHVSLIVGGLLLVATSALS